MGWVNCGHDYVPWHMTYGSPGATWQILLSRCWLSNMWCSPHHILWSTLSSCWVGPCRTSVIHYLIRWWLGNDSHVASYSPVNLEELFNLCHTMAQNVIERIFSVLKWQFQILIVPPELDMHWQARLPAALAAIHNFIWDWDLMDIDDIMDPEPGARAGELAQGVPRVVLLWL